jgi:glycosyltransferase involved in cell wall biosynthesis
MTRRTRVLFEIHPHTLGGAERFLVRFLERLDRQRYEPIVISQKRGLPLQMVNSMGIRTESVTDYFSASGARHLAEFIRRNRVGLVQSNYYASQLAMASNLAGVPHIWRLGGHVDVGAGVRSARDCRWALDMIRLLSKSIICNSKYVRTQFRGRSDSPDIQVIPNGISAPVPIHRQRTNGFSIGMIAHFTPQKRHVDFIRAAELVVEKREDVSFKIFGMSFANPDSRSYSAQVQRWGLPLKRKGKLSISEFSESGNGVLREFDCVVLPSVRESFSNAILESMALGIPVIAANSGGNPELVKHLKTGFLVPPMRPKLLAKAMLGLLEKPELIDRMGRAALKRTQTHFSLDDCVRRYEDAYSRVVFDSR